MMLRVCCDEYAHTIAYQLTSILHSLGSTLHGADRQFDPFFARWDKNPRTDELTPPEAIQCLEMEYAAHPEKKVA
jgi:phosphatidylserine decarboxylase